VKRKIKGVEEKKKNKEGKKKKEYRE